MSQITGQPGPREGKPEPQPPASILSMPVEGVRTILQGLWACRVSLLSIAAGFYVMWNVPQAHDLFVELHTGNIGQTHWALFFVSVLVFWILPVHLSARLMLETYASAHPSEFVARGSRVVNALPWLLSLLCIVAVALAMVAAKVNIPVADPNGAEQVKQLIAAATSQVDTLLLVTGILALSYLVVWVAIYPVVLRLTRKSGLLDTWLVGRVAELLFDREKRLRGSETLSETEKRDLARVMTRRRQIAVAAILLGVLWLASWTFVVWRPTDIPLAMRRAPMLPVVFGAWVPILTLPAFFATRWRLPIMALFIIALALFGTYGRNMHMVRLLADKPAPASLLTSACFPDYRATHAKTAAAEARQIGLEAAITMWRQANGCPYGQPCKKRPIIVAAEGGASRAAFFAASVLGYLQDTSPASVSGRTEFSQQLFAISSVSGGTLGAAAFVATLDETGHTRSGGVDSRPIRLDTTEKPADTLWFRNRSIPGQSEAQGVRFQSWVPPAMKDPMQVMLAGDFLSPVTAGLGLDVWWGWQCEDRAAVIERAWESRFEAIFPPAEMKIADAKGVTAKAATLFGAAPASPDYGMARSLTSFLPTADRWRPLLIFNGVSVSTGRRIVTSTLHPLTRKPHKNAEGQTEFEPVLGDTYDFYDHLCRSSTATQQPSCQCQGVKTPDRVIKGCDIRLSTAVSNSARFPLMTPQGDIRDPAGDVHDRIVDGGYFDNFGVLSAQELATQLRTFDERLAKQGGSANPSADALKPFVLLISNDPEFNPQACAATTGAKGTSSVSADSSQFNQARYSRADNEYETRTAPEPPADQSAILFSDIRYPINAALRSWTASARTAPTRLSLLPTSQYGFGIVQVCPQRLSNGETRQVSMNWWLSMPIQAYLDSQVCGTHNDLEMRSIAAVLAGKSDTDADWSAWTDKWQLDRVISCDQRARPKRSIEYGAAARMKK